MSGVEGGCFCGVVGIDARLGIAAKEDMAADGVGGMPYEYGVGGDIAEFGVAYW